VGVQVLVKGDKGGQLAIDSFLDSGRVLQGGGGRTSLARPSTEEAGKACRHKRGPVTGHGQSPWEWVAVADPGTLKAAIGKHGETGGPAGGSRSGGDSFCTVKVHSAGGENTEKSGIFAPTVEQSAYTEVRGKPRSSATFPRLEETMASKRLTIPQRKEIFQALVTTQDSVHNVRKSYEVVTEKFDITESQLKQIEDEGLDKEWPPLCELMEEAV
jgi:hypothetical protein